MHRGIPTDIIFQVIQFATWEPKKCERTSKLELAKAKFHKGIASSCKVYRGMYINEWSRHLTLRKIEDWKFAIDCNFAPHVRNLTLQAEALPSHTAVKSHLDFSQYQLIQALTLDCHNDVGCSNSLSIKGQWSYKKIIPNLPTNLRSLIVLNAHGPDLQVIHKAVKQCKSLESLTLGRCTKFNRPEPCGFWNSFPNDHDSYFSGQGVEGYANALATELQGLRNLKSIFVNVYLTDTKYLSGTSSETAPTNQTVQHHNPQTNDTITTDPVTTDPKHTTSDQVQSQSQGPISPDLVQSQHRAEKPKDQKDTEEAENIAADILFKCHRTLQRVGFISYWSENHLGWSVQDRKEDDQSKSPGHREECDGINTRGFLKSD